MSAIAERYQAVRNHVADAADCVGRSADEVAIVAVAKHVGVPEIRSAVAAGIRDFGENRVQEFLGKRGLFPDVRWHFIGTLQTNKVKDVVGRAYLIHSVDSLRLLQSIDRKAREVGVVQDVLLQVNVSGEASKHGFDPDEIRDVLVAANGMDGIRIRGLMTMAPLGLVSDIRWVFGNLRDLRDSLSAQPLNGVELAELSMGMTNDYRAAVEEGSTIVRVGRAIFGR